ncbi:hypothetical protein V6Z11_A10G064600 [Gossypium hirsutum]
MPHDALLHDLQLERESSKFNINAYKRKEGDSLELHSRHRRARFRSP